MAVEATIEIWKYLYNVLIRNKACKRFARFRSGMNCTIASACMLLFLNLSFHFYFDNVVRIEFAADRTLTLTVFSCTRFWIHTRINNKERIQLFTNKIGITARTRSYGIIMLRSLIDQRNSFHIHARSGCSWLEDFNIRIGSFPRLMWSTKLLSHFHHHLPICFKHFCNLGNSDIFNNIPFRCWLLA